MNTHSTANRALSVVALSLAMILPACAEKNDPVSITKLLIESVQRGNKIDGWPHMGPLDSWELGIDTFTNEVSSKTIAELYTLTCKKLADLYGEEVKTYFWTDQEGWPRIATVVQFKIGDEARSYLVVRAFQNNDNDSFSFDHIDGEFDIKEKKLMPDSNLPEGLLRNQ